MKTFSEIADTLGLSVQQRNSLSIWANATGAARKAQLEASWGKTDLDLEAAFRQKAGEIALDGHQVQALLEWHAETSAEQTSSAQGSWEDGLDWVKLKLGASYTPKLAAARRATAALGMNDDAVERMFVAIGPEATFERLAEKGQYLVTTQAAPPSIEAMAPDQAAHAIAELKSDSGFMQKWISGDRIAAGRMDALHNQAFPEPAVAEGESA